MRYESTKTYGHEQGLSACFRQWKAESHCKHLHGYALAFKFTFGCDELDQRHWVQDFGGLKDLKAELTMLFDHRLLVALDDPLKDIFMELERAGCASVHLVENVGCEAFAWMAFDMAVELVERRPSNVVASTDLGDGVVFNVPRVKILSCECSEHSGNSAIYRRN